MAPPPNKRKYRSGAPASSAQRGRGGGGAKRARHEASSSGSGGGGGGASRPAPAAHIDGPGIFLSCPRGKERNAAADLIDLLNELVEEQFAHVKIEEPSGDAEARKAIAVQEPCGVEDDDDLDALMNGAPPQRTQVCTLGADHATPGEKSLTRSPPPSTSPGVGEDGQEDDDIEAQIRAELADLEHEHQERHDANRGGDARRPSRQRVQGKPPDHARPRRFWRVETGVECFQFVRCARPLDPAELVHALLLRVERTGEARSRFVQRMSPVCDIVSATVESVEELCRRYLPLHFNDARKAPSGSVDVALVKNSGADDASAQSASPSAPAGGTSFKVEFRARAHNVLRRDDVIAAVASVVTCECAGGPHRADLKTPERVILVEVFKGIAGVSVVCDYERLRRYNPLELAKAVAERRARDPNDAARPRSGGGQKGAEAARDEVPAGVDPDLRPGSRVLSG